MPAGHRSAHPDFPGVPWWGAVLVAVAATVVGFAFDAAAGEKELGAVFATFYAIGCLLAVLAVRQSGIFTAVIQPPLILFAAVPVSYYLFHSGEISDLRGLAINCGYPLIERFPLMFFTSAAVLLIGMARWYYGTSEDTTTTGNATKSTGTGLIAALMAKASTLVNGAPAGDKAKPKRRRHAAERAQRPARAGSRAQSAGRQRTPVDPATRRPARRTAPPRPRHGRQPDGETFEPQRPGRARPGHRNEPPQPPTESRRRARDPRRQPPPEERRPVYDRPRRPANGSGRSSGNHHPISRVRYRGIDDDEQAPEYPTRARRSRGWEADYRDYPE